jgi:hypothetical protein
METPKKETDKTDSKSARELDTSDDTSVESSEKKNTGRRLQDAIISKDPTRKMNLDRRTARSDRRADTDPKYKGPARRFTIDRRLTSKDRRDKS